MKTKTILSSLSVILGLFLISFGAYSDGNDIQDNVGIYMVSHSEYRSSEQGQIIGKLFNFKGNPIIVNYCAITIYNPDKSTYLTQNTDNSLESTDGTHYINFTTPTAEGIYEYKILCQFLQNGVNTTRSTSNSFHLNPALNTITNVNTTVNGLYNELQGINNTMNTQFGNIQLNFSTTITKIEDVRANIFTSTDAFNNFTHIETNFQTVYGNFADIQANLTVLMDYCGANPTANSQLCQIVSGLSAGISDINSTINNVVVAKLDYINQTTINTYDYMTGTLASNINTIINNIANMQNGINQINSTVNDIKTNVTTVISNQEDVVYIDVMS